MQGAGSIYFATLQWYVINETELYNVLFWHACRNTVIKINVKIEIKIPVLIFFRIRNFLHASL